MDVLWLSSVFRNPQVTLYPKTRSVFPTMYIVWRKQETKQGETRKDGRKMEQLLPFCVLIAGFILLIWGADHFVAGASELAKKMGIPPLIIGLTVVAFGTSAPELTVSATAGMQGANALAISNVLGSNLFNLLVVIGGCSIFTPQVSDPSLLKRDWPFCLCATGVLLGMIMADRLLSRSDAMILLFAFVVIIITQIRAGLKERTLQEDAEVSTEKKKTTVMWFNIFGGMICIYFGGEFCVSGATDVATLFGLSETIIGLTVVSVGTSLPELVTSVAATRRGEKELAIGNVVGSNLFNLLLILGVSGMLTPIPVANTAISDTLFLFGCSIGVYCMSKRGNISRMDGLGLVGCYVIYMTWVVMRDLPVVEAAFL